MPKTRSQKRDLIRFSRFPEQTKDFYQGIRFTQMQMRFERKEEKARLRRMTLRSRITEMMLCLNEERGNMVE